MLGLYIHIPFCQSICSYCDFPKFIASNEKKRLYVDKLINDLDKIPLDVDTIYIGGGTPNSLDDFELKRLFEATSRFNPKEFTVEINPELLTTSQARLFAKYHINRISMGVQTFNDSLLKKIGRKHHYEDIKKAVELLKQEGIVNINVDLIYGIPDETLDDVKRDLEEFLAFDVPHISFYSLILEEKTILYHQYQKGEIKLIDEDLEATMYETICDFLNNKGFHHYEISNFAKPGFESLHNQVYWHNEKYYGVGLGASGYIENKRYTNSKTLKGYLNNQLEEIIEISKEDALNEEFLLGLRLVDGVSISKIEEKYQISLLKRFPFINQLIDKKLLEIAKDRLKLTKLGLLLGNEVFAYFV